ncbi:MAG: nucleotidyltransferase domain-containing protein [Muribaculaceae bacterium]|nr:nucleotidyltransferase domain-containing protein [Muribaculaceae bacterium]
MISDEYIKILSDNMSHIQKEYGVTGFCLYGSTARGDNGPGSDVDILVDMPPKIFLMSVLKEFLEEILCTSVDLVRRHSRLSVRFLNQISRDGIKLL